MIFQGDGLAILERYAGQNVDAVISDLPSGKTRMPGDDAPDLQRLFAATWAALKPRGIAVFMASHLTFAADLQRACPEWFRYDLIWRKSIATGFLNAKKQPLREHEFILVFCRKPGTYSPQKTQGPRHTRRRKGSKASVNYGGQVDTVYDNKGERYPRSVLHIASLGTTSRDRIHPQQKPAELMQWLVRTYTNSGDLIIDPFCGSGSTVHAAIAEGRRGIGIERDPERAANAACAVRGSSDP